MVVHCWHKDRAGGVRLSGYLGEEAQLGEQCHPCTGEPEVDRLTTQCVHLRHSASGSDGEQEGGFPGQVLEWAGHYGFEWGFGQSCLNQLQTPQWCNHVGISLGVLKTFNPSLKHRVQANWVAVDHCMPT